MKNLWYYKLDSIDTWLVYDNTYNWYIFQWNINAIKDKDWEQYNWFWLLKLKNLLKINLDFSVEFNFDLDSMISYVIRKVKIWTVANGSSSTTVANETTQQQ